MEAQKKLGILLYIMGVAACGGAETGGTSAGSEIVTVPPVVTPEFNQALVNETWDRFRDPSTVVTDPAMVSGKVHMDGYMAARVDVIADVYVGGAATLSANFANDTVEGEISDLTVVDWRDDPETGQAVISDVSKTTGTLAVTGEIIPSGFEADITGEIAGPSTQFGEFTAQVDASLVDGLFFETEQGGIMADSGIAGSIELTNIDGTYDIFIYGGRFLVGE